VAAVANQSNTSGGILADKLGWVSFLILTTVATIPALALLVWIARRTAAPSTLPRFTSTKG
jgi:nitrate/nitrite transporter NarK